MTPLWITVCSKTGRPRVYTSLDDATREALLLNTRMGSHPLFTLYYFDGKDTKILGKLIPKPVRDRDPASGVWRWICTDVPGAL